MAVWFDENSLLPRGTGPVATVYMTTPTTGGKPGAVKVYPGPFDRPTLEELLDEQRTLAGLRTVSSILLIDGVQQLSDGRSAIRMELCARSLTELVEANGPLPVSEVVGLGETIAGVLLDAHAAGIVHGGVTPANVLYRQAGQPVLADFGLGLRFCFPRAPEAAAAYIAPEVLRGAEPTESADLYGLGALLYLALAGHAPFAPRPGEPAGEVLLRALSEPPRMPPVDPPTELPVALSELVTGLLAKDPAVRPGSAAEVFGRLRELAAPVPPAPQAQPIPSPEPRLPTPATLPMPANQPTPSGQPTPSVQPMPSVPTPAPDGQPANDPQPGPQFSPMPALASPGVPATPVPSVSPTPTPAYAPSPTYSPPSPSPKRQRGGRQLSPLLLAVPAVLAVFAVLLGILGGGGIGQGDGDGQNAVAGEASGDQRDQDQRDGQNQDGQDGQGQGGSGAGDTRNADSSGEAGRGKDGADPAPSPESSAPASVGLEIHQVKDHGDTVDLTWRSDARLTYAVFVAEQGDDSASADYRGTGTTLTVQVEPDLKYCFQVQGTDGSSTFESPPRGIRGATCRS